MKLAIAAMGEQVAGHFGHCENFILYEIEGGAVKSRETVPNPGHKPGFLPNFLADRGVEAIVSGGMGGGAIEIFNQRGVEVITGASGEADEAVARYLKGALKSTGSICHEHVHAGSCGKD